MAYIRKKRIKGHEYYYLVESYRQDGKVKTRTLKYLGTSPNVPPEFSHCLGPRPKYYQPLLWDPEALGGAIARQVMRGPLH
jgi:hypothetical protein